jgi:hypothetical protein
MDYWLCSHLIIKSGGRIFSRSLSILGGRFFVSYTTKVAGSSARVYGVLTFHSPVAVQVARLPRRNFFMVALMQMGKWRKASLDWIFAQELPLFLCTIEGIVAEGKTP